MLACICATMVGLDCLRLDSVQMSFKSIYMFLPCNRYSCKCVFVKFSLPCLWRVVDLVAAVLVQVISVIENRADQLDYVLVDTPGQIKIFTWSASGAIITEALASTFPTIVTYVVDTPRSANPQTFMSSMLYACSILYGCLWFWHSTRLMWLNTNLRWR